MSGKSDLPLEFRTLHESCLVSVRDYVCRACRGGPTAEESSEGDNIVLMRSGAFCKHFGRRAVTADVNQACSFPKVRPTGSAIRRIAAIAGRFSSRRRPYSPTLSAKSIRILTSVRDARSRS